MKSNIPPKEIHRWEYEVDVIAWAPLPISFFKNTKQSIRFQNSTILWPCILYPSWSKAMRQSELFTQQLQPQPQQQEMKLRLIGCKKSTSIHDLRRNRVPGRVALGSGTAHGGKYRLRVVAHFLGLGSDHESSQSKPSWGAIEAKDVRQYTLESCRNKILELHNSTKDQEDYDCKWNRTREEWNDLLLLAMREASIVMEQTAFDPSTLCKRLQIQDMEGRHFLTHWIHDATVANGDGDERLVGENRHNRDGKKGDVAVDMEMTPECFNDWKEGGYTQKHNESQTQNFSQITNHQPSFHKKSGHVNMSAA